MRKIIDVQPSTVLNEKELVADAHENCSHAAPPCSAESRAQNGTLKSGKVCHEYFVCFADVYRQTDSFG